MERNGRPPRGGRGSCLDFMGQVVLEAHVAHDGAWVGDDPADEHGARFSVLRVEPR